MLSIGFPQSTSRLTCKMDAASPPGRQKGYSMRRTAATLVHALVLAAPLAVAFCLVALPARGQEHFRVTYTRGRDEGRSIVLTGTVSNVGPRDVVDVYVTAAALNGAGKVVASGIAFVASAIPRGGSVAFTAKIPQVDGIQDFRVGVSSFRSGGGPESP